MAQCILLETGMGTVVTRIQPIYLEWKIVVHLVVLIWCYQKVQQMELCYGFMPFKIQGHSMQLILQLMQMNEPILLFQTFNNYGIEFDRSNSHNIPAYHATTHAMILVQFDNEGQVVWKEFTKEISKSSLVCQAYTFSETSLVVSPDGNITFSGGLQSSSSSIAASFGIGSGNNQINLSRNSCSNYDQPFIVRLDSTGTPLWVRIGNDNPAPRTTGCTHQHFARDLAVKSDGG